MILLLVEKNAHAQKEKVFPHNTHSHAHKAKCRNQVINYKRYGQEHPQKYHRIEKHIYTLSFLFEKHNFSS